MSKSEGVRMEEFKPVVEEIVEQKLIELLGDPDSGLELRPAVKKRLELSLLSKERGISAEEVGKKLGLE